MKKIIAIDIDEVLVPYVNVFCDYINKYKLVKNEVSPNNFKTYNFSKDLGCDEKKTNYLIDKFQHSYEFKNYQSPLNGSQKVLKNLKNKYKLVIVTSRHLNIKTQTKKMIKKHFGDIFDEFYFGNEHGLTGQKKTKGDMCKDANVDLLVDDRIKYCKEVLKDNKKTILFGYYAWNKSDTNLKRAKNWGELQKIIEEILQ